MKTNRGSKISCNCLFKLLCRASKEKSPLTIPLPHTHRVCVWEGGGVVLGSFYPIAVALFNVYGFAAVRINSYNEKKLKLSFLKFRFFCFNRLNWFQYKF
jgi:hypothetical protein